MESSSCKSMIVGLGAGFAMSSGGVLGVIAWAIFAIIFIY